MNKGEEKPTCLRIVVEFDEKDSQHDGVGVSGKEVLLDGHSDRPCVSFRSQHE
jgi:hypothetical protein